MSDARDTPEPSSSPAPHAAAQATPRPPRLLPPLGTHAHPATFLSASIPGTGGVIKARPEDFLVEELPAYEPAGSGEHIYLFIEKRNLTTSDVVRKLATHFNVRRDAVGFAGLKDRFAVTRQLFSVHTPGKKPADFPALQFDGIVVHWTDLHANKLRRGHLLGNRFVIRIRSVDPGKVVHAMKTLKLLNAHGAPNRVGEQRFGVLGQNHLIGRALLAREAKAAADALLGLPADVNTCPPSQREARHLYHEGKFEQAIDAAPRSMHAERRALAVLARGGTPAGVVRSLERFEQSFFVSALQSALFNIVLDHRIAAGSLGTLGPGDVAFKHDSGAVFAVSETLAPESEELRTLAERCARLEISASGPMWGTGMMPARAGVLELEQRVLHDAGLSIDDFVRLAKARLDGVEGARRPLRVPLSYPDVEAGQDEHGPYIRCTFELPRGAFATSVMHEIIKPPPGSSISAPRSADSPEDEDND